MNSAETALSSVLLVVQRGQVTVSEVAAALEIAPSTAHRALSSCRRLGFVRQDVRGGPYLVGPALHEMDLLRSSARSLRDAADSVVAHLHREVGETVGVMIREGHNVRLVHSLVGTREGRPATRVGEVFPAHSTAGGKAILSALDEQALLRLYPGRRLDPAADGTVVDWSQFERDLAVTRRRGWAYSTGASDPTVGAVAAPIVFASGESVAAITIAAPLSRLGTRREAEELAAPLVRAASKTQSRLRGGT